MITKFLFQKNKLFVLFLFLFSLIINQYYGNLGVFPMDSFHFFDSGYRVLNGDIPFVDFWLVKGSLLDYFQAGLFYLFGINWQVYVLHASLINAIISICTFFLLKNFSLKSEYCFLFSLLFSILAYPSSGTPFIDHHSAFFSLLGIYCLILAIYNKKKIYWVLLPIFFTLAFFSKQVPATYIILSVSFILVLYFFLNKTLEGIKYLSISFLLLIIFILIFGKSQGIKLEVFLDQYIFYPSTIGLERIKTYDLISINILEKYIFILISILPLIYINFLNFFKDKNYIKNNNFFLFLILLFFTISLIFHQTLTKNQIFIFFLIPILTAFSQISLIQSKFKFKKFICFIIILSCIFSTFKYHFRINEERKFHELSSVNLKLAIDAKEIDKKLSGLNWITPQYYDDPKEEINLINQIKSILKQDNRNKMLITNYPFFSVILNQKIISPSRVYTGDGTTHPIKGNEYVQKYKELMDNLILKNNVSVIYVTNIANEKINFHYIDSYNHCFEKKVILEQLTSYDLENCI